MESVKYGGSLANRTDEIDPALLRTVCGHFVTGVTVVTTMLDGQPIGLTINSFTSVSLEPPLILFCLHQRSGVTEVLRRTRTFAVNILAEDQEHVSRTFAGKPGPRFHNLRTHTARTGAPIFVDSLAYLDCNYRSETEGGDHIIVLGEVVDLGILRNDTNPLTFFRSAHAQIGGRR